MRRLIVGVGHKKERGKDALCDLIQNYIRMNHRDIKVRKIGFADKLKDVAHQVYGWAGLQPGIYYDERRDLKEAKIEKLGRSPREIYISIGNMMREIYSHTWIDFALNGIDADVVLIKDMGFINEAKAIQEFPGGVLIRIDRDGPMADDPREVELDNWNNWDYIVDNTHSLRELNDVAEYVGGELISRL